MVPEITHLQFLVLHILMGSERAGHEIRDELAENGVRKSGPAFYQLMARLEDAGFVKGRYVKIVIDGQTVKERRYKIKGSGATAYNSVEQFYASKLNRKPAWGA